MQCRPPSVRWCLFLVRSATHVVCQLFSVDENLSSLDDIFYWAHEAGVLTHQEKLNASQIAHQAEPAAIDQAYAQLIALRESLYGIFFGLSAGGRVEGDALGFLNEVLVRCAPLRTLTPVGPSAVWAWRLGRDLEEVALGLAGRLATQAAALLTSEDLGKLKCCASQACDWLFLDTSKNGQRRWCQMSVCGSKEKASRARLTALPG